jgi:hypothetical protein
VRDGALGNCVAQCGDSREARSRDGVVECLEGVVGHPVEVVVIAPEEFDQQRLLAVEVVIQAARLYSGCLGDVMHRRPQP